MKCTCHANQFYSNNIESKSFNEYVCNIIKSKAVDKQFDFLSGKNNKLIVDFIGRYENLNDDFKKVCDRTGITCLLHHYHKSNHGNYRKYYNQKTKELIAQYYKKDIVYFEYKNTRRFFGSS